MTPASLVTVGIVGGTFTLLARPRLGGIPLSRSVTSAVGAVLVVLIGALTPTEAFASLDTTTLLLLFGMLCHVEALGRSGCYEWIATTLVDGAGTARQLTLGTLALSACLSAVALNDATVLLLTPILVTATRRANLDPVLPLLAVVLGANVGSLATPLGNPQNAFILAQSGMSTATFIGRLLPVTVAALLVTTIVLAVLAGDEPIDAVEAVETSPESGDDERSPIDWRWTASSSAFVLATLSILALLPDARPGLVAAAMGIAHIAWVQVFRRVPGEELLRALDWSILVMFAGIFVLVGALEQMGVTHTLIVGVQQLTLPVMTFVLSNLVSNVPAVVLLAHTVGSLDGWVVLAAVSTLAGTATPIGSAATLIVLEQASQQGVDIPLSRLVALGLPISVLTSLVAVGLLSVV